MIHKKKRHEKNMKNMKKETGFRLRVETETRGSRALCATGEKWRKKEGNGEEYVVMKGYGWGGIPERGLRAND